jgi:hypothetical protein
MGDAFSTLNTSTAGSAPYRPKLKFFLPLTSSMFVSGSLESPRACTRIAGGESDASTGVPRVLALLKIRSGEGSISLPSQLPEAVQAAVVSTEDDPAIRNCR